MADVEFAFGVEEVGEHMPAGQRARRQRRDEVRRRLREHAAHGDAALLETTDEIERLVGGDAAADDQQHALRRHGLGSRAGLRRCRRIDEIERLVPGLVRGFAQDGAHLVLHGASMAGGAQAKQRLQPLLELADGERGHRKNPLLPFD